MSSRWPRIVRVLLFLVSLASLGARRAAADEQDVTVHVDTRLEISAAGDREATVEIVWGDAYEKVKERSPDARRFLQEMLPERASYEMRNSSARYDDARKAVVMHMTELAAAKNFGGGRWELEPEPTASFEVPPSP